MRDAIKAAHGRQYCVKGAVGLVPDVRDLRRLRLLPRLRRRRQEQGPRLHDRMGPAAGNNSEELSPRLPGDGADHRGGHRRAARVLCRRRHASRQLTCATPTDQRLSGGGGTPAHEPTEQIEWAQPHPPPITGRANFLRPMHKSGPLSGRLPVALPFGRVSLQQVGVVVHEPFLPVVRMRVVPGPRPSPLVGQTDPGWSRASRRGPADAESRRPIASRRFAFRRISVATGTR